MNKFSQLTLAAVLGACLVAPLCGCSHSAVQSPAAPSPTSSTPVDVVAAPPQTFNPVLAPPQQQVQAYGFLSAPAPIPLLSTTMEHHRHRYLHIVLRDHRVYLADDYGHYYATARDDNGDVYPIYQDPGTEASYPLYYDDQRDTYYRCVVDGGHGYYRNYVGDPDDEYYQGDPDQEQECESQECQPFVINYDQNYYGHNGYDPKYGHYNGPRYSRRDHDFVSVLPVIVAAYILLEPGNNDNFGGGGNYGNDNHGGNRRTIVINQHNYYQHTVIVNNYGLNSQPSSKAQYAALPGPPIGHFHGYRQPQSHGGFQPGYQRNVARVAVNSGPSSRRGQQMGAVHTFARPAVLASSPRYATGAAGGRQARLPSKEATHGADHFRGARQNGRQVMSTGSTTVAGPSMRRHAAPRQSIQQPRANRLIAGRPNAPRTRPAHVTVSKAIVEKQRMATSVQERTARVPSRRAGLVKPQRSAQRSRRPMQSAGYRVPRERPIRPERQIGQRTAARQKQRPEGRRSMVMAPPQRQQRPERKQQMAMSPPRQLQRPRATEQHQNRQAAPSRHQERQASRQPGKRDNKPG